MDTLTTAHKNHTKRIVSPYFRERVQNIKPGDPSDLLKGLSDLFVSYEPNFGFQNTLEFEINPKSKNIY